MALFIGQQILHCLSGNHHISIESLNRFLKAHVVAVSIKIKEQILIDDLLLWFWKNVKFLVLNVLCSNAVFSIDKLNNISLWISNSFVIGDNDILQGLNKSSLYVSCLRGLDSCIYDTFSATHSMEVELLWCQTLVITIGNKASTFWTKIILQKARQGSVIESKGHSLTLNILLTNKTWDLWYVYVVSFGPRNNHVFYMIF